MLFRDRYKIDKNNQLITNVINISYLSKRVPRILVSRKGGYSIYCLIIDYLFDNFDLSIV